MITRHTFTITVASAGNLDRETVGRALQDALAQNDVLRCSVLATGDTTTQGPFPVVIPCIAYTHIKSETSLYLLRDDLPFMSAISDEAIFLTVPACAATADDEQRKVFQGLPQDLQDVFAYMQDRAPHAWFMLSPDGDVMPNLPTYESEDEDMGHSDNPAP